MSGICLQTFDKDAKVALLIETESGTDFFGGMVCNCLIFACFIKAVH